MNRRSPSAILSTAASPRAGFALFAGAAVLFALASFPARGADLPSNVRNAADVSASAAMIKSYVADQVKKLQGADPKAVTEARVSLLGEVQGITPPSNAFLDVYDSELKDQLLPLTANPSIRVRLNVAIITAKIAQVNPDARLTALTIKEVQDPNEGVVLWGMKTAHWIIPSALNIGPPGKPLIPAIIASAQRLGSGPIINAAYDALIGEPGANSAIIPMVLGPTQDLLAWRVDQYAKGTPSEASADIRATNFLVDRAVWKQQAPPQQTRTVQLIVTLIGVASADLPTVAPVDRDMFITLLSKAAKSLTVVASNTGDDALRTALGPLRDITSRTPDAAIAADVTPIFPLLALKWPSVVTPKAPTTATTTTGPTTTDTTSGSPSADAPN